MALEKHDANRRFYELFWPLRADLLRMARLLSGNAADADDLAQETLLKAFSAIDSFRAGSDAKAWLLRIMRNARIDRIRSAARHGKTVSLDAAEIDVADEPSPPAPDHAEVWRNPQDLLNAFSDQQVIDAMQQLPEDIRLTLLLVDVQQMDHREAGEILDVPVGTIKSRTHRGRQMLRQVLLPMAREMRMVK
jgi:RNA polymerase sigma-70 factor, ECF subfamily